VTIEIGLPEGRGSPIRQLKESQMNRRFVNHVRGLIVAIATLAAWSVPASAADPDGTVMLVATPALSDPIYRSTVLIARPMEDGRFLGFIINKPTKITLAQAFPEHGPSKRCLTRSSWAARNA